MHDESKKIYRKMYDIVPPRRRPGQGEAGADSPRLWRTPRRINVKPENDEKLLVIKHLPACLRPKEELFYPEDFSDEPAIAYSQEKQPRKSNEQSSEIFLSEKEANASLSLLQSLRSANRSVRASIWRPAFSFGSIAIFLILAVAFAGLAGKSLGIKNAALVSGEKAYADLADAKAEILNRNFAGSQVEFAQAYDNFSRISGQINEIGGAIIETSRFLPYLSKLSSGAYLAKAGEDVSRIGILAGKILQTMDAVRTDQDTASQESVSLLKIFQETHANSSELLSLLKNAEENLNKVNVADIPEERRAQFASLRGQLPEIQKFVAAFVENGEIFTDILGGNGPRKYLFLFQNNQEMRATGGFIGTYGVLDIFNGNIRKFYIDGIFNPDGQLIEKIVPPKPIQKISIAWSLHDSNWFPDFPVSAELATLLFEKTGGPTVDGVITLTPEVMQKMLGITGPIEMPEYGLTIDRDNFIEQIQQEVELDYDREFNQPKKVLADLAPMVLDKVMNAQQVSDIAGTMDILLESLQEKHILIYSKNFEIEKKIAEMGWSGEVLSTQKDYLSVINTNINGFKTDGVIDETIEHQAEIQPDGTVIDTLIIIRRHNGGLSQFDWWNKVNANYQRVYVPRGSQLLSAEGQTREFNEPPIDYNALNFKRNPQVQMEEDSIRIDDESGTRIYDDADKTVFANWVYVSPQETVTVKYRYLLPFKIIIGSSAPVSTYSLLAQKQSGSKGSEFIFNLKYPANLRTNWKYPDNLSVEGDRINFKSELKTDKFIGVALFDADL